MKRMFFIFLVVLFNNVGFSQLYQTRTGVASFHSSTSLEEINATNKQVYAVIDMSKKQIAVSMLMKGFEFKKELMQIHFNENYVESDKFPKATFVGSYTSKDPLDPGINTLQVSGSLTIHGITKTISVPATLQLVNGELEGNATFKVLVADYNISVPALVRDNISKEVTVSVRLNCNLKK